MLAAPVSNQLPKVLVRLSSDLGERVEEAAQSHRDIKGLSIGMEQRRPTHQKAIGACI